MKYKKLLISLFSVFLLTTSLVGCNKKPENYNEEIYRIYELAKEEGYQGTYEEWLESIKGEKGEQGIPGADGTSLHTGTAAPNSVLGKNGDSYLNTSTWDFYVKENDSWVLKGNIQASTLDCEHRYTNRKVNIAEIIDGCIYYEQIEYSCVNCNYKYALLGEGTIIGDEESLVVFYINDKMYSSKLVLESIIEDYVSSYKVGEIINFDGNYYEIVGWERIDSTDADRKYEYKVILDKINFDEYKDFKDPKKGQVYNVKGVITERISFSSGLVKYLYLQNDDCGIMAYGLVCADQAAFDADLKVGNEIIVSGTVARYNGQLEFEKGCTYSVVSKTASTLKYVDATEAFTSAVNEKDVDALDPYQNRLIEVKGVTVADIYEAQNYHYFTIGNVKSYVRPSASSSSLTDEQCKQVVAEWVQGYKANVKGILTCYSGTYYILPVAVDAVTITEKVLTDEVKLTNAINDAKALFTSEIVTNSEITLPTNPTSEEYKTVGYTWSVVEGASAFVIEGGKLKVTVGDTPVAGKVKVVAIINGKTAEHVIQITAKQPDTITVGKFIENANKNDIQYVKGVVVAAGGDSDYAGSFVLADETGVVFSYNKFKVNVGDEIIIATKYSEYSGLVQSVTTEVVSVVSTGNDVSKYLANPVAKSIGDLSAELEDCTTIVEMYEKYGQKCIQATGTVKKTDKGYAMYLNAEDNQYILNLYANSTIDEQLKTLLGSASSVELTVTGFVRGVGTANPDKGYHANLTLQLNNVVAA